MMIPSVFVTPESRRETSENENDAKDGESGINFGGLEDDDMK